MTTEIYSAPTVSVMSDGTPRMPIKDVPKAQHLRPICNAYGVDDRELSDMNQYSLSINMSHIGEDNKHELRNVLWGLCHTLTGNLEFSHVHSNRIVISTKKSNQQTQ